MEVTHSGGGEQYVDFINLENYFHATLTHVVFTNAMKLWGIEYSQTVWEKHVTYRVPVTGLIIFHCVFTAKSKEKGQTLYCLCLFQPQT